ncbi:hypothetical protein EVAR_72670_1 [Eumeta japonica]|uniref:Uncharacterized protein n=1 Tax=Eumeta variegata TaxID=151549 RepID=A0A4C1SE62_EUMVA|nr:hypothetical protein EVAR_72670_1 [Eumeta japonica]
MPGILPSSLPEAWHSEKWLEADKSYKLTSPHTTMLQPNRHLNHGWQSFSLGITLGYQPPWYRYYNPRVGLEEQSYSTAIGLLSSEDSVRHYQTVALLGLYIPIAERQGVAPHQDQNLPPGGAVVTVIYPNHESMNVLK